MPSQFHLSLRCGHRAVQVSREIDGAGGGSAGEPDGLCRARDRLEVRLREAQIAGSEVRQIDRQAAGRFCREVASLARHSKSAKTYRLRSGAERQAVSCQLEVGALPTAAAKG